MHPLEALNKEIERQGVVVIDDVNYMPSYGEPYISPHLVIVLCHEGVSRGEQDMRPFVFRRHDFSVVYPNHTIMAKETSDDYRVSLIVISKSFYEQIRHRLTYGNSQVFYNQLVIHVADEHYQCLCDAVRLLKSVGRVDISRRTEVIADILDLLSLLADEFRQKTKAQTAFRSSKNAAGSRSYFNSFYESLVNHFRESREVRYYARQLCLSPKYFGTIIKQETGVSAGDWIARYVIIRAKTLLRYRPDLTIQQVYQRLGFSDAASFSRYFKNNTGMTAKEYREQNRS